MTEREFRREPPRPCRVCAAAVNGKGPGDVAGSIVSVHGRCDQSVRLAVRDAERDMAVDILGVISSTPAGRSAARAVVEWMKTRFG